MPTVLPRLAFALPFVVAALTGCQDPAKDVPKTTLTVSRPKGAPHLHLRPAASMKVATPVPSGAPALSEPFAIDPGASSIGFVGSKVTGKHEGKFSGFSGTITLADGKPEGGKITVEIDLSTVKTEEEKLDAHLKSKDFFDVEKYPKAVFTSTAITVDGDRGGTHTITGDLDLHGVKKSIVFPAKIQVTPDGVTGTAELSINRKDFKIEYPGMANDLIRDEVVIKLSMKAVPPKR